MDYEKMWKFLKEDIESSLEHSRKLGTSNGKVTIEQALMAQLATLDKVEKYLNKED